jgi:PAT family beta-lactamase induction signal transducer AmpG
MVFGILQALSNFGYWVLAVTPPHLYSMAVVVAVENLCGGLGTAAFVALLMALCKQEFSATQFALLSALSAVGRTYLAGPLTPPLVEALGWPGFFVVTIAIALPGLAMLRLRRAEIEALDRSPGET